MRRFVWGFLIGLMLFGCGNAAGETTDLHQQMHLGNEAYERGDFLEAVEFYSSILDTGLGSADLHYNLGNAYLKAGQLGWAVLNYERALQLNPRDPDIRANLTYARSRMVDVLPDRRIPWLLSILGRVHNLLDLRQLLWLASSLWFAIILLATVSLFRERLRLPMRVANPILAAILGLSLTSLGFKIYAAEARHPGIVVAEEVQVMSGPGSEYAREFVLHAGTRIEIKRSYQDWYEVALSDEMRGWIAGDAVEGI
jgi:tetratricopeptide (TPR) repeat protein